MVQIRRLGSGVVSTSNAKAAVPTQAFEGVAVRRNESMSHPMHSTLSMHLPAFRAVARRRWEARTTATLRKNMSAPLWKIKHSARTTWICCCVPITSESSLSESSLYRPAEGAFDLKNLPVPSVSVPYS